jgi:hypothetical protein
MAEGLSSKPRRIRHDPLIADTSQQPMLTTPPQA